MFSCLNTFLKVTELPNFRGYTPTFRVALFWQGLVAYKAYYIDSWLINGCRSQYEGTQPVVLMMG